MQKLIGWAVLLLCAVAPLSAQDTSRFDISAGYTFVRSNAPPGACGCFSMNGTDASGAYNLTRYLGVVGDFSAVHAGNVNASGQGLTLTSYLFGPQVSVPVHSRFRPFGHVLVGGVHAGGLGYGGAGAPDNAFAAAVGGGVDWQVNRSFSVRLFEADYYLTHFQNGANSEENNLRLSFGVVFHIGKKK
jgi:peptidoglycan-associated lipoprotein